MSCRYSGLPVVSSFSPKKIEFAPAIMHSSCASSFICSRPAESRTIARGIRMRAQAIIRTISIGSTGRIRASGVPSTATSALIGTDSGCGSCNASVASIAQRCSTDSPIPMIPPQQTPMPASRTARSVVKRSS